MISEVFAGNVITISEEYADEANQEGYAVSAPVDGMVTVLGKAVAKVGNTYYATLAEAIANAVDGNTITLLANIDLGTTCVTVKGKELTINLNGYNITGSGFRVLFVDLKADENKNGKLTLTGNGTVENTGTTAGNSYAVYVGGNSELVVEADVTVKSAKGYAVVMLPMGAGRVSTLTVNGGTVTGRYAVSGQGALTDTSTVVTVNGGAIIGTDVAIYQPQPGTVTVNGGTVTGNGDAAIAMRRGTLTINDGVINGVIDVYGDYSPVTATINGGDFTNATLKYKDGNTVTKAASVELAAPEGYKWNDEGVLVACVYVAQVGDVKYESLAEAIANANGGTVVLLDNIALDAAVTVTGTVTLDLNGYVISGTCNSSQSTLVYIENGATFTLKDTSDAQTGKITYAQGSSNVGWTIDVKGTFVLESGTIELTGDSWSIGYAVDVRPNSWGNEYKQGTSFVMNGGKIISSDGGVRVASSSSDKHTYVSASFEMNGGLIDAAWDGVFVQQSDAIYDKLSVTINAGTIESDLNPIRVYGPAATGYVDGNNCMNITLAGGTLTYTGTDAQTWLIEGILRVGGGSSAATIVENGNLVVSSAIAQSKTAPEGYKWTANDNGTYTLAECNYVAEANGVKYETLAEAIAAGGEVKLLADITLTESITVTGTVKLDLAGFDITMTLASVNGTTFAIKNNGTLTITNSTVEVGEICLTYTGERNSNASISTIGNYGTLNIEGGKINCVAGKQAIAYAIDSFANSNVAINISGGEVYGGASGYCIRMFLNSTTNNNVLNVTGGKVGYVWAQNTNAYANKATINVTGGTVSYVYVGAANGGMNDVSNIELNINAKNVEHAPYANLTDDKYEIRLVDGVYKLVKCNYVAQVDDTKYESLAEAFANANGKTVVLLDNIAIDSETITIADGTSVTFDMNGKKITVTDNKAANVCYELFYIYGELTVTGNGTIELTSTSNDTAWAKSSSVFHNRGGVLTIENGTFTHLGGTCMAFVVDNSGNWYGDATTNINGSTLTSTYTAIRNRMEQNTHGASGKAILNITGGTINGTTSAIWAQAASTSTVAPATGEINISGGEIGLINTARSEGAVSMTTITGGTVAGFKGEVEELTVRGGTLESVTILTATGEATEYAITADGLYTKAVAKVGGVNYATLAEAIANANGGTVELLANIELNEAVVINGNVTINLANFTVANVDTEVNCVFHIENGTVTIKNGTISTNNGQAIYAGLDKDTSKAPEVTLENVKLNGADFGLSVFGGANVTIGNDVVISGSVEALRVWNSAKVTVNEGAQITCTGNDKGKVERAVAVYENAQVTIKNGTFTGVVDAIDATSKIAITGGTFTFDVNEYCADGYICVANGDGTYTVREGKFVAQVGETKYETLQAAIDAANGGTVTLLETFVVNAGETVALDLKGCTIVANAAGDKAYEAIRNNGTLTITNGTVVCNSTSSSTAFAINTITNCGSLTITKATIKNVGTGNQIGYAIDNNSTTNNATLVVGDGAVITAKGSAYFDGIRLFCNSLTAQNNVTVNGGEISSIWMQNPSDGAVHNTKAVNGSVKITNGTVGALYIEPSANFALAISGGHVEKVDTNDTANSQETAISKGITGGTFGKDETEFVANGYYVIQTGDKYTVKAKISALGDTLSLGSDLSINFYYPVSSFDKETEYYAVVTKCHDEDCKCGPSVYYIPLDKWAKGEINGVPCYIVVAREIAAKEMICDIKVEIFEGSVITDENGNNVGGNGYSVSNIASDSIVNYVKRAYSHFGDNSAYTQFYATMADALVYGSEAQKHFEHYVIDENGDPILANNVNAEIAKFVEKYCTKTDVELEWNGTYEQTGTYLAGTTLSLENVIHFNIYYDNLIGKDNVVITYEFTNHNGAKQIYTTDRNATGVNGYFDLQTRVKNGKELTVVTIDKLTPSDLSIKVKCTVAIDGEVVSTSNMSVADHCGRDKNNADLLPLYESIMKYGNSCYKYFHPNAKN